jgi:two-component system nitrogen regulation sensor histidine kinase NtrY
LFISISNPESVISNSLTGDWFIIQISMGYLSGFTNPPRRNGSRTWRYILASIVFLMLAMAGTLVFLHRTSVGSPRYPGMAFLIYTATTVVILALLILATVLGRNLIKLYFEKRSGQLGSGFKTKMVSTFIALSLLPALLLFLLAYSLISSSIERWFSAPPAQIVDKSQKLAQQYYAEAEQRAKYYAAYMAGYFQSAAGFRAEPGPKLRQKLQEFDRQYALGNVRLYDTQARVVAESENPVWMTPKHEETIKRLVGQALIGRQGFQVVRLTPDNALNEITWATAPVKDARGSIIGAILTETLNPQSAKFNADSVVEASSKYEQLQREKASLRVLTLLILVLSTLLIVFAFSWFAMYLAKRITIPIQALAQGAAEVAAGNLAYRVQCQAFDELGSLVASFNRMTGDLQENEKRIEAAQQSLVQKNVELVDRRRYIETILQTIATGVISIDSGCVIRTMNRAAVEMLGIQGVSDEKKLQDVVHGPAYETLRTLLQKSTLLGTVVKNIELAFSEKRLQVAATVTPLLDSAGQRRGWVIVLDDMTELLRMEKMSAWQEVARRVAHEIKNPLTPIQLSAERILRRYRQLGPLPAEIAGSSNAEFSRFDELLNECVRTIIQEVRSLKNLVNEFSRFARLPEIKLQDSDLNSVLENTLYLYNGRIADISVQKEFDRSIPKLKLDTEQMKRVFINLFDNALEAMADNVHNKVLFLRTSCNRQLGIASVEIGDTGRGFPEEYQDSLFLPYFSRRTGGTGLGLAIVRQIVSDHHGNVRAEANVPVGTRIIIDLPLATA